MGKIFFKVVAINDKVVQGKLSTDQKLLKVYTEKSANNFSAFLLKLNIPEHAKTELLKFPFQKETGETFQHMLAFYSAAFPIVFKESGAELLRLYTALRPLEPNFKSEDLNPILLPIFSSPDFDSKLLGRFTNFVETLNILEDSKIRVISSFEKQNAENFVKLLNALKFFQVDENRSRLMIFLKGLNKSDGDSGYDNGSVDSFSVEFPCATSTPLGTLERHQVQLSSPDAFSPLLGVPILKGEIRKMFASPNKVVERQAILDELKKNVNGEAIVVHLLKNNWRLFLGHSKFKKDLKLLDFSRKSSVLDTTAGQY